MKNFFRISLRNINDKIIGELKKKGISVQNVFNFSEVDIKQSWAKNGVLNNNWMLRDVIKLLMNLKTRGETQIEILN